MINPTFYMPDAATIVDRKEESDYVFTLSLRFNDPQLAATYQFEPGQFNMVYLFGVGEVAISILADPINTDQFCHTIRSVGRVTKGLSQLQVNDQLGIRGPFGRGWPLQQARGKDILIITGGLGCAPSVSIIQYIMQHRHDYGRVIILQGVKHSQDLLYRAQYERWAAIPGNQVLLAADVSNPKWPFYTGLVTELIDQIQIDLENTICMMCGPEAMMRRAVQRLEKLSLKSDRIYLSLERNMECAIGHCGHCQFAGKFTCKDGPVFQYADIKSFF